jgi:hypothetical protein
MQLLFPWANFINLFLFIPDSEAIKARAFVLSNYFQVDELLSVEC